MQYNHLKVWTNDIYSTPYPSSLSCGRPAVRRVPPGSIEARGHRGTSEAMLFRDGLEGLGTDSWKTDLLRHRRLEASWNARMEPIRYLKHQILHEASVRRTHITWRIFELSQIAVIAGCPLACLSLVFLLLKHTDLVTPRVACVTHAVALCLVSCCHAKSGDCAIWFPYTS